VIATNRRYRGLPALALALALLPLSAAAATGLLAPLAVRDQGPLVQIHGLPADLDPELPPPGTFQARLALDVSSNFAKGNDAAEQILLDGELYRTTLSLQAGLGRGWLVGLELPWIAHRGGFLDSFVENWHDVVSLPQGGRNNGPRNRLAYRYLRDGVLQLELTEKTSGIGDQALTCAKQILRRHGAGTWDLALGARLELPTGDADRLQGSGSTDLALWLAAGSRAPLGGGWLAGQLAFGVLAMSRGEVLAGQQRPGAAFGRLGLAWSPVDWVACKLQLDAHSPLYQDSDLDQLNAATALLTLGGTLALPRDFDLDLGVGEDVAVETAPDIAFHLALSRRF
jgi:hypothetical protein